MSTKLKKLKDPSTGEYIYPETSTEAIYSPQGESLETHVNGLIDDKISETVSDYKSLSSKVAAQETKTSELDSKLNGFETSKQDTLVSGTNLKTINNTSLLGSGNITIEGGGGSSTPSGDPCHYLFTTAGAEYNDTGADVTKTAPWGESVTHKAGYWYLNGLGDITNEQMREIYNIGYLECNHTRFVSTPYMYTSARTFFPIRNNYQYNCAFQDPSYTFSSKSLEVLKFRILDGANYYITLNYGYFVIGECPKLKHICTPISMVNVTQNWSLGILPILEDVKLKNLKCSYSFKTEKCLNNTSILYMITNAANGTTDITITLHADAYARAVADSDIQTALTNNEHITLASA